MQQYVNYAGHQMRPYFTTSGVSQRSNVGPLEFILMVKVNDLPNAVKKVKCLLFAAENYLSVLEGRQTVKSCKGT